MTRLLAGAACLVLNGCGVPAPPAAARAPIPPPAEGQRAHHPAGYSIVFPPGLEPEVDPVSLRFDSYTRDALGTVGERDRNGNEVFGVPRLTVRRFSDTAVKAGCVPSWYQPAQFQGRAAFAFFDPGYGPGSDRARRNRSWATGGGYYPHLQQERIFEHGDAWFQLTFTMHNLDRDTPIHTQPLDVIQQYFDTFEYNPAGAQ